MVKTITDGFHIIKLAMRTTASLKEEGLQGSKTESTGKAALEFSGGPICGERRFALRSTVCFASRVRLPLALLFWDVPRC
jgi:hypothetical protein